MIHYRRFTVYHIGERYTVFDPKDWSMEQFETWKAAKQYMKER